jgi:hypothetical protein
MALIGVVTLANDGICASCLAGTWNTPLIVAKRRWCLVLAAPHSIFNVQRHLIPFPHQSDFAI